MFVRDRALLPVLSGLFWLAASTSVFAQFDADIPKTACIQNQETQTATVGKFVFRAYRNDKTGDACLKVFHDGKVVFKRTLGNAGYYKLGQPDDTDEKVPAILNGTDITGRGYPDMIVSFYTGGAHCCLLYYVFELEPELKLLATLDAEDGDGAHFALIDRQYYFIANDWTFAYWQSSFAGSPAPEVILRYVGETNGGSYHLAFEKMERPEPTAEEWNKAIEDARSAFGEPNPFSGGIGTNLWGEMLEFIYHGHSELAWKLFDESWPRTRKGKTQFLADFCSQLKRSSYWPDLKGDIKNAPAACVNVRSARTGG